VILDKKADEKMKNFKGTNIGFISKDSKINIDTLSKDESLKVLSHILASQSKINLIKLDNKVVVYKITDTKFSAYDTKNDSSVSQNVEAIKLNMISESLLNKLKTKYTVKTFMGE
jgi:peptidyl-prolyl cis-trans isomerase D